MMEAVKLDSFLDLQTAKLRLGFIKSSTTLSSLSITTFLAQKFIISGSLLTNNEPEMLFACA